MTDCLLSICIPSFKRLDITRNTIRSILDQSNEILSKKFQIVLVDNDPDSELHVLENEFQKNFVYIKSSANGFLNTLFAMRACTGKVIKLHNNTMLFRKEALETLIKIAEQVESTNSLAWLTNGNCGINKKLAFDNFNEFIMSIGYQITWSNCLLIKSKTLNDLDDLAADHFFPHLEVLLNANNLSCFLHCDREIFSMQFVKNKGGYNIFRVFSVDLFGLLNRYKKIGHIDKKAVAKVRTDLLWKFFPVNIFKSIYTSIENYEYKSAVKYLRKTYKASEIILMFILAMAYPFLFIARKLALRIHNNFHGNYLN